MSSHWMLKVYFTDSPYSFTVTVRGKGLEYVVPEPLIHAWFVGSHATPLSCQSITASNQAGAA